MKRVQLLLLAMVFMSIGCSRSPSLHYPSIAITEKSSPPASLSKGSVVNQAFLDFEKWMGELDPGTTKEVGLEIRGELEITALSDCTLLLWQAGFEKINLSIAGGNNHVLLRPLRDVDTPVLRRRRSPNKESFWIYREFYYGHTFDHFVLETKTENEGLEELLPGELKELAASASLARPLILLINRDLPLFQLEEELTELERIGANWFSVLFYIEE